MHAIVTGDRNRHCNAQATRIVGRLVVRYGRDEPVIVHGVATDVDSAFDQVAIAARVMRGPTPSTGIGAAVELVRSRTRR
jgi:hypothetical protein